MNTERRGRDSPQKGTKGANEKLKRETAGDQVSFLNSFCASCAFLRPSLLICVDLRASVVPLPTSRHPSQRAATGPMSNPLPRCLCPERVAPRYSCGSLPRKLSTSLEMSSGTTLGALTGTPERLSAKARTWTTQFLMAGVCGGFTTFSSFNLQTLRRLRDADRFVSSPASGSSRFSRNENWP